MHRIEGPCSMLSTPVLSLLFGRRRRGGPFNGRALELALAIGVALALAAADTAFAAPTEFELSGRVPVAVGVGNGTEIELGLNADLVSFPMGRNWGVGLSGQLTWLGFSSGRRQLGLALAYMPDVGGHTRVGLGLDFGVAADARGDYLYGRTSYQIRSGIFGSVVDYACSSAIYLELRRSVDGPTVLEGSVGIELGGGLFVGLKRIVKGIGGS